MNEILRQILYPLGFIAQLAFGLRFLVQWIESEKAGKSIVKPSFWRLSFLGNLFLAIHGFVQAQFFICLIQSCNAVISWRNLNLRYPLDKQASLRSVFFLLFGVTISLVISFYFIVPEITGQMDWFRVPVAPWNAESTGTISIAWHIVGFIGYFLFSSRFWVQWWVAEKMHESVLNPAFWWISLSGAFLSIIYFARIGDAVNLVGPAIGLLPYLRNIMLIEKNKTVRSL